MYVWTYTGTLWNPELSILKIVPCSIYAVPQLVSIRCDRRSRPFRILYASDQSTYLPDLLHVHYYINLFARLRDFFSANSFCSISTIGAISPLDLVPTSSRFRTLTERLSSSSCPTTRLCEYAMSSRTMQCKKRFSYRG